MTGTARFLGLLNELSQTDATIAAMDQVDLRHNPSRELLTEAFYDETRKKRDAFECVLHTALYGIGEDEWKHRNADE